MKVIMSKYFFFGISFTIIIGIILNMIIFIVDKEQTLNITRILIQLLFLSPLFFILTSGRMFMSILTINEEGVKASALFKTMGTIKWSEMQEVGIGSHNDPLMAYMWIYFSKRKLTDEDLIKMQTITQNDEAIKIRFSKKAIQAVQKYYHGEIKNLSDDMKGQFFLR